MKTKSIFLSAAIAAATTVALGSCNDYLDTLPDNRAVLDTKDKISNLLVSAYPQISHVLVNELVSDNVDFYGYRNPNTTKFLDETYFWQDEKEADNESMKTLWVQGYNSIAVANQALQSLDENGFNDAEGKAIRAEALLCRAYGHFLMVNQFSMAYNGQTGSTDLGVPISTEVEELNVKKSRGSVADVYAQIDKDLQEALPLVTDNYVVPKYHFNRKAAYAFATRFYLFYEKWEKALEYANACLGALPASNLRDWKYIATLPSQDVVFDELVNANANANLLLSTYYSQAGLYFGPYTLGKRYSHGAYLGKNEDFSANNVWGKEGFYKSLFAMSGNNFDIHTMLRVPYKFQYTDPVAGNGYFRTVLPLFTYDETLLNRAEAYVMLQQYDNAAADLNTWMHNMVKTDVQLTPAIIQKFYNSVGYSYADADKILSTVKKHLNPKFTIDAEGSVQETMLQCVLGFRRMETIQQGQRWWDIKRYGIEIPRREIDANGTPTKLIDWLGKDDPRRALQIPLNVRDAGLPGNPRAAQ
ncbi:MAG: RagB/SusD family nutrient uptake outer membrane protein [Bacteroidaceae bacterium]|nr:RagB/SusD family nutrient uptake outer membrane protein [Bacteroidaceae bacterium]